MSINFRISEIFHSIEGEGPYVGWPTLFIRFFGCNFTCKGFSNPNMEDIELPSEEEIKKAAHLKDIALKYDRGCDSIYSWHPRFKPLARWYDLEGLHKAISAVLNKGGTPEVPSLVSFTGGEPMLHQLAIVEIVQKAAVMSLPSIYGILIETNGSIAPNKKLISVLNECKHKVIWSNSPKLSNSCEPFEKAIRPKEVALQRAVLNSEQYFKFVSSGKDSEFQEILTAIEKYREVMRIYPHQIYVMPEGATLEQQNAVQRKVAEQCMRYGFNFCPRIHVNLFGNEVGT